MQIHGPSVINPDPTDISVDVNAADPERPFVNVQFPGGVHFYLDDGDADTLIKVFCQAKEMLAAHRHAVACHSGLGEYVNGTGQVVPEGTCGAGSVTHSWLCTRVPGHPGEHYTVTGNGAVKWPAVAEGLPVAEDDGGDGDDNREPYCLGCLFSLDAAGEHMFPDGVMMPAHEIELGWREPVGRPVTQAGRDLQDGALAAEQTARDMENAQSAEVRRIGKLHTDGHITADECAEMVDKVIGEHA